MEKMITAKPTDRMIDLLLAMRRGVTVHYMDGINSYFFRNDTMASCSASAYGLLNRGLAEFHHGDAYGRTTLVLTHAGKAFRLTATEEVK